MHKEKISRISIPTIYSVILSKKEKYPLNSDKCK